MIGIIFCVCWTLAISVLPIVLNWCRKERKKMQVKKESQQSRNRCWIWSRDTAKGLLTSLLRLHLNARGKPDLKVKYLWARGMSSITEQGEMLRTLTHQVTQSGKLTKCGHLKRGNLVKCWKQERRDPWMNKQPVCSHSTRTDSLLKTIMWILTPLQNQTRRFNPDHSCTGWMIKCERCRTNPQKMQHKTATNILEYGECLCLRQYKHLYSWERIT